MILNGMGISVEWMPIIGLSPRKTLTDCETWFSAMIGLELGHWRVLAICLISFSLNACTVNIELYRFAGHIWKYEIYDPSYYEDPNDQRLARGFLLYKDRHYREAKEAFEQLFDSSDHRAEALLMVGLIYTKEGDVSLGERYIKNAILEKPEWALARVTLVWNLCIQERFDEAEDIAREATEIDNRESIWSVLIEVRNLRESKTKWEQSKARWQQFWRRDAPMILGFIVAALIIFYIVRTVWNKFYKYSFYVKKLHQELEKELGKKMVTTEDMKAQILTYLAQKNAALLLNQNALESHLEDCRTSFEIIDKIIKEYQHALKEIDKTNLSEFAKQQYRDNLENGLKDMVSQLSSSTQRRGSIK